MIYYFGTQIQAKNVILKINFTFLIKCHLHHLTYFRECFITIISLESFVEIYYIDIRHKELTKLYCFYLSQLSLANAKIHLVKTSHIHTQASMYFTFGSVIFALSSIFKVNSFFSFCSIG